MAVKSAVSSWASGNMAGNPSLSRYGQSNRSGIAYSDINAEFHSVQSHNSSGTALGTGGAYQLSASQLDGNNTRVAPGAAVLAKGTAVQPYHQGTSTSDAVSSGSATSLGQLSQSQSNVNLGSFRGTSARLPFRAADNETITWTGNIASQNSNNNVTSRDIFTSNGGHGGVGATNGGKGYMTNMITTAFARNTVTSRKLGTVAAAGDVIVVLVVCLGSGSIATPVFKNSSGNTVASTQVSNIFNYGINQSAYNSASSCTYAAWIYTAVGGETTYTTAGYAGTGTSNLCRVMNFVVGNGYTLGFGNQIGYQESGKATSSTWAVSAAGGFTLGLSTSRPGDGQFGVFTNMSPYVGFYPTQSLGTIDLAVKTNSTNQTTLNYGSTYTSICMNQSGSSTTTTAGIGNKPPTTNTVPITSTAMSAQSPNHSENLNFLLYFLPPAAGRII